ncbi:F-box/kelch-repeat protein At3g06240-like [Apium graveolens]|uniref:F-box/kelch-repeat protein At3g06240-like n=1 Tax=Apium graveolens TaxID=4045 RepID=UPI003D78CA9D
MAKRLDYINFLPEELLITNIFTRLPAKSVGRCKCVSKPWYSLISSSGPDFVQAHLAKTTISKLALISVLSDPGVLYSVPFCYDYRYNYKNPNCKNFVMNYCSRMEGKRETKTKLIFNVPNKWYKVWGSCDGLILVQEKQAGTSLFVLNPTTLESRKLPDMPKCFFGKACNVFGFGYDFSRDDYAVVVISDRVDYPKVACVYIFMLKTKQWEKVGVSPYAYKHQRRVGGVVLKGCLHWLTEKSTIIAAYDIAKREFSGVPLPVGILDSSLEFLRLGVLKGCLCLFSNVINNISELFVMKEYGVVESWTKLSVVLADVSHVASLDLLEDRSDFVNSGQSVLLVSSAEKATVHNSKVLGLPNDFRVGMSFIESLVSPNEDGKKKIRAKKSQTIAREYKDDISGWLMAW